MEWPRLDESNWLGSSCSGPNYSQLPQPLPAPPNKSPPTLGRRLIKVQRVMASTYQAQLQGQTEFAPDTWKEVLLMLLMGVTLKRRHASIEEALSDDILDILMQAATKAMPGGVGVSAVLSNPQIRANVLRCPGLRREIDQKVLARIPTSSMDRDCDPCAEECSEVLAELNMILLRIVAEALAAYQFAPSAMAAAATGPEAAAADPPWQPGLHDEQPAAWAEPLVQPGLHAMQLPVLGQYRPPPPAKQQNVLGSAAVAAAFPAAASPVSPQAALALLLRQQAMQPEQQPRPRRQQKPVPLRSGPPHCFPEGLCRQSAAYSDTASAGNESMWETSTDASASSALPATFNSVLDAGPSSCSSSSRRRRR